ncbi:hypothetical protein U4U47_00070, partial [Klebsiella pneumoniae]|nr:hypothetical protein [Escherichia coli]
MNTNNKTISMRVPLSTKKRLEHRAIELSYTTGRTITWTQVALYLMENGDLGDLEEHFSDLG